jgi:hypothetical protein
MPKLLIKSGLLLILLAGAAISVGLVIFAFFALLIIAPGLLLYNAGLKSLYNSYENNKMIDVTPQKPAGSKVRAVAKGLAKKLRDFLNKYAD